MFNIIIKESKEFLREKTYLFFFILFPILLVFLLGNLLNESDIAESTIGTVRIDYQINTEDAYQTAAIGSFLDTLKKEKGVVLKETKDLEQSKRSAGEDKIAAAVSFSGYPLQIQVFEGTDRVKNRTVEAILRGFIQNNRAATAVMKSAPDQLTGLKVEKADYAVQNKLKIHRSMIDYYAISMVVMIAFFSTIVGANAFMGERQNKTINRLIIAPQNRVSMFLQKICGMVPQSLLQIGIIMVVSVVAFHANYGATWESNLYLFLLFFVITFCMVSIGAVVGLVIKMNPFIVLMPVIWIMMFCGGSYSKEIDIKGISDKMPNYLFQKAAFDVAIFGNYNFANRIILACVLITIAALMVGAFLFYRKEEER